MAETFRKRETAYKVRIGELLKGEQIFQEPMIPSGDGGGQETLRVNPRLLHVDLGDHKFVRVNIIANVVDKFESDGETRFASLTVDDGSGQIKARVFGEDLKKFLDIIQGDTLLIIGMLRAYNHELYILPEIVRKLDSKYLLVRKLEIDKKSPVVLSEGEKGEIKSFRDDIIVMIKTAEEYEGIDKDEIIMKLKNGKPDVISQEIQKLLEEGIIYEPKPGRVRYLG